MSDLVREFEVKFDQRCFPPNLLERYEPTACLAEKHNCQTYLLCHRQTGREYIAKAYPRVVFEPSESAILHALSHLSIPRVVDEFEHEGVLFVVREYVPGQSLIQLSMDGALSEKDALSLFMQLCDIASYLHRQSPPVVHRDIKPSNLVQSQDGRLHLIDFEIARRYDASSDSDTVLMLTRDYAAPEAFGYQQTDARSDIYSMGVVLLFLLTGESDVRRADALVKHPALLAIVRKCTAFSPNGRYQSADALARALRRAMRATRLSVGRSRQFALGAAALCLALVAGYLLGRASLTPLQTPVSNSGLSTAKPQASDGNSERDLEDLRAEAGSFPRTPEATRKPAVFTNPIIEQAVRLQLGKLPEEPLYQNELPGVYTLYISLGQTFATPNEVNRFNEEMYWHVAGPKPEKADIGSLEDLRALPNVWMLTLFMCSFDGIAPLADMPNLTNLDIVLCEPRDVDVSALGKLKQLSFLRFEQSGVSDFSALAGMTGLKWLYLGSDRLDSYDFLDDFDDLHALSIGNVPSSDIIPRLRGKRIEQLDMTDVYGDDYSALGEIEGLRWLSLKGSQITTLKGMDKISTLETLDFMYSQAEDVGPLLDMPSLKLLRAPSRLRPQILALPQPLPFEVEYS